MSRVYWTVKSGTLRLSCSSCCILHRSIVQLPRAVIGPGCNPRIRRLRPASNHPIPSASACQTMARRCKTSLRPILPCTRTVHGTYNTTYVQYNESSYSTVRTYCILLYMVCTYIHSARHLRLCPMQIRPNQLPATRPMLT